MVPDTPASFHLLPPEAIPPTSARPESILQFAKAMLTVTRAVNDRRLRDGARLGLSDTEIKAMGRIAEGEGLSAGRLGELLALTTGSVTALVDRLVAAGMVERKRNPADKRAILLVLTDQGLAGMRNLYIDFQVLLAEATVDLDQESLDAFTTLMLELSPKIRPSG